MKKRKYESPQMEVASIENMQIICNSPELEQEQLDSYTDFEWEEEW